MRNRPTNEQFRKQLKDLVDTLRREISEGVYAQAGKLPPEKLLAARFGLSNNSVRKGLEQLVEEGLIEKVPRVGNRVRQAQAGREPVELTIGCYPAALRSLELTVLLEDIQRQFPWISIRVKTDIGVPEIAENVDVVLIDHFQFWQMVESGRVSFLESFSSEGADGVYPQLKELFMHEGRNWLRPIIFSPIVLCYNKAHFRECGLEEPDGSWTWSELIRAAERLSDGKGRYGFSVRIQDINRWPIFLLQSGERFEWEPDGRLKELRGTRLLESIKACKNIIHNRKASPLFFYESNGDALELFMEGRLSMVLNSYMGLNVWKHADLDYDVTPMPFLYEPRTLLICLGAGVCAGSRHKEEARRIVDYLGSPRARDLIAKHTLTLPALRPLPASVRGGVRRPERYNLYREMMFSYRTHRDLNIPSAAFPKLLQQLRMYWADLIDEDELCERIGAALSAFSPQLAAR
jgi:multiple sugar transport system substrate-binding protein